VTPEILARARGAENPFLIDRVDSAWQPSLTDVSSINRAAYDRCRATIEAVRSTGQSRGLLLTGEPGSGKSHLLHRIGRAIGAAGRDCFAYIPPVAAPGRLHRELLRRVVGDILRQEHDSATTQLEALVVRALLAKDSPLTPLAIWNDVRRRFPPGPTLFKWLEKPFDRLVPQLQIDPDVALVLRHYLGEHERPTAFRWLMGYSVSEEALERLGVSHTLEEDADARAALFTLSRLAGKDSVLVLAFDQLEGMQLGPQDFEGVHTFGHAVADLLIQCRNIAVISCVQQYFRLDLERQLPLAHMQRIAQDLGRIELLASADIEALVAARLAHAAELGEARRLVPENLWWPLTAQMLREALPRNAGNGLPARTVLNAARLLFDRWQTGAERTQAGGTDERLSEAFESRRASESTQSPDEGTLVDGLLKLLQLKPPPGLKRSKTRGIDFEWDGAGGPTGVAVCHTTNMTSLSARLKQVGDALDRSKLRRAVIVRDARLPISPTAKVTRSRLQTLEAQGNVVLRPEAAAYAALAAARLLLTEAAAGDLAFEGHTIDTDRVRSWLLAARPAAAFDLLDAIVGEASDATDELIEQLRVALTGNWIAPLDGLIEKLGLDAAATALRLESGQHAIGFIAGPPAVVFLRPDGLPRT
jgi:hypothetical protein